ncbi:hypothetical protein [Alcaligenes sp. SDU_A2]|uniref:hypothetical protein n=1 Tax=Alcaligenes sp. SDU_A2 TaxID=3136634 RepID=UPI00311ECBD1
MGQMMRAAVCVLMTLALLGCAGGRNCADAGFKTSPGVQVYGEVDVGVGTMRQSR